jgi:nitroimidazol reductase NimA-like FMN-containing flavoprotein (pyridoxamine 5'-phosphate oxidase superfamily)
MIAREESWLETLAEKDCRELLGRATVGRIGFVTDGVASILPVNFIMSEGSVVFCTRRGGKLSWLGNHCHVAFEVDDVRHGDHEGWSVLIRGSAHEITDAGELELLRRGGAPSWLHGSSEHWVRIVPDEISGRALHAARTRTGIPRPLP